MCHTEVRFVGFDFFKNLLTVFVVIWLFYIVQDYNVVYICVYFVSAAFVVCGSHTPAMESFTLALHGFLQAVLPDGDITHGISFHLKSLLHWGGLPPPVAL